MIAYGVYITTKVSITEMTMDLKGKLLKISLRALNESSSTFIDVG